MQPLFSDSGPRPGTGMTLHAALVERRIATTRSLIDSARRRRMPANLARIAAATSFRAMPT
jgi:hypothetical protein